MTRPIQTEWLEYRKACIDPWPTNPAVVEGMRHAFYAGALAAHGLLLQPLNAGDQDGFLAIHEAMKAEQELQAAPPAGGRQ